MKKSAYKNIWVIILSFLFAISLLSAFDVSKVAQAKAEEFTDYTVVKDADGNFVGIKLNDSFDGTLYAGIKDGVTLTGAGMQYAVLEFRLSDSVYDKENGGLLIQISSKGNTDWTFMRVFVFADDTSNNRFYSAHTALSVSRKDNLILEDGSVATVDAVKSRDRGNFPKDVAGTLVIPWKNMKDVTSDYFTVTNPKLRVLIALDVSADTAAGAVGEGISIGKIATYTYKDNVATVVSGLSTKDLTYTSDAENIDADVNLADIKNGKTVYATKEWNTAISAKNYLYDEDESNIGLIEFVKDCPYKVTVNRLDSDGASVSDDNTAEISFDGKNFTYKIETEIEGFTFLGVDGDLPLSGSLTEDITVTLRYSREAYDNYDVITDFEGNFKGIDINDSLDGAMYFGIKGDAELGDDPIINAVTEFKLSNTIYDYENGGLLIQFSTVGYAQFNTQVEIFVNGSNNNFFRVATALKSSRTDLMIFEDGSEGSISISKGSNCARIPANVSGTWMIPWKVMLNNTHGSIDGKISPQMRVAVQTDLSIISAQGNEGNGISIGVIATYVNKDNDVTVVKGISTKDLNYSYDENTEGDVNIADITRGTRVFNRYKWNDAISIRNYLLDTDLVTVSKMEYKRASTVQIPVNYVDENGETLSASGFAKVVYGAEGLEYTVNIPEIIGYDYKTSDKPLTGVIAAGTDLTNFVINLTYERTPQKITLKFVNENGEKIKDDRIVDCYYNEYLEITPDEIGGYEYVSSSRKLKLTVLNNYTIVLTYAKSAGGCGSNLDIGLYSCFVLLTIVSALVIIKKKGKKN